MRWGGAGLHPLVCVCCSCTSCGGTSCAEPICEMPCTLLCLIFSCTRANFPHGVLPWTLPQPQPMLMCTAVCLQSDAERKVPMDQLTDLITSADKFNMAEDHLRFTQV